MQYYKGFIIFRKGRYVRIVNKTNGRCYYRGNMTNKEAREAIDAELA